MIYASAFRGATARFDRRWARRTRPRPPKPNIIMAQAAGSGMPPTPSPGGESTPARKAIGGRLIVLPLSPQARKLSRSVEASAVRVAEAWAHPDAPREGGG